jgi:hypothetical protein
LLLVPSLFTVLLAIPSFAQEFRATLNGTVTDAQGAIIPGATVIATQTNTGSKSEATAGASGQYTLPFLAPGSYTVEATSQGFKRFRQENIQLGTNQRVTLNISLEVGDIVETVTVTSDAPLLTSNSAATGQVISQEVIESIPMSGRTPMSLAAIAFGVTAMSDPRFTRPFDNAGPSGISMGGAPNRSNELLNDGAPNTTRDRRVAYNPPVDAVGEVKVEVFQSDASYGNTGGGTVNVTTKAGTNRFRGALYNFNQVEDLAATDFFVNQSGGQKTNSVFNQWGVSAGGPVFVPKLFDGRNKLFWQFNYEGIKNRQPEPFRTTVPTPANRTGDFSQQLALGSRYQIHDPLSGALQPNGTILRSPFAGNVIPQNRISAIAPNVLSFFPQPNAAGAADSQDNYQVNTNRGDDFYTVLGRTDLNISDNHKMFFSMQHNERTEFRGFAFGLDDISQGNFLKRINWGAKLDDVYTFNPTTILNTRLNWTRFTEGGTRPSLGFDMTSLGFPSSLAAASSQAVMPGFDFGTYRDLGNSGSAPFPFDNFQIFSALTKLVGNHSFKFGTDLRLLREHVTSFGNSSGFYQFRDNFVRGPLNTAGAIPVIGDMATFLLGLPTSGNFDVAAARSPQSRYVSFFAQDDWRVTNSLTLQLGLRYEKELRTTERYNRQVVGFDATTANAATAQALAVYNSTPALQQLIPSFDPRGGLVFANPNNRSVGSSTDMNFSPRIGFAYTPDRLGGKTVFRGGFGLFYFTEGLQPSIQPGFQQRTQFVPSDDGGLTFIADLSNPFPNGILPAASTGDINTFLGQSVTFYNPEFRQPYSIRWNFTIQHQLAGNLLMEVGYIGNSANRLQGNRQLNFFDRQFLSTTGQRDQNNINFLSQQVTNPFAGLLPGTGLNGARIQLQQLLRPFAQFNGDGGVTMNTDNFGSSYYHGLQARLEKRFANGFSWLANYQWARTIERRSFLNNQDFAPEKRIADEDRPHRFVATGVYLLPFGRGQKFANSTNGFVDRVIGGWQINGIYTAASANAVGWGNLLYLGGDLNWNSTGGLQQGDTAFDVTQFNRVPNQQLAQNLRTFGSRFSSYRINPTNNVDFSFLKNTRIAESVNLQFRAEFFNFLNTPAFNGPNLDATNANFGRITSQRNLPRQTQLALRLTW